MIEEQVRLAIFDFLHAASRDYMVITAVPVIILPTHIAQVVPTVHAALMYDDGIERISEGDVEVFFSASIISPVHGALQLLITTSCTRRVVFRA